MDHRINRLTESGLLGKRSLHGSGSALQLVGGVEADSPAVSSAPDEVSGTGSGACDAGSPDLQRASGADGSAGGESVDDQIAHVDASLDLPSAQVKTLMLKKKC